MGVAVYPVYVSPSLFCIGEETLAHRWIEIVNLSGKTQPIFLPVGFIRWTMMPKKKGGS